MEFKKSNRIQILQEAITVSGDRDGTHGDFTLNMKVNDNLLAAYFCRRLEAGHHIFDGTGRDACIALALNKIARIAIGSDDYDHYLDAVNYIAQAGALAVDFSTPNKIEPTPQEVTDEALEELKLAKETDQAYGQSKN